MVTVRFRYTKILDWPRQIRSSESLYSSDTRDCTGEWICEHEFFLVHLQLNYKQEKTDDLQCIAENVDLNETTKKTLNFITHCIAFYFLGNTRPVNCWKLLKRKTFRAWNFYTSLIAVSAIVAGNRRNDNFRSCRVGGMSCSFFALECRDVTKSIKRMSQFIPSKNSIQRLEKFRVT